MQKNTYPGKFIVFEGIDGSGKATQLKLLANRLKEEGHEVVTIDFPQYGQKSAGPVEEYLNGKYGSPLLVGPYRASIFYACDRYDASFKIREWLKQGKIVVSDRYFASNVGHQGGKIKNKNERKRFIKWLYDLEFKIFGIPKPDLTLILEVPPRISRPLTSKIRDKEKAAKKKLYLGRKKRDAHEKDLSHLVNAERSYLELAQEFPQNFIVIDCIRNNKLLEPEIIHQKIWKILKRIL